MEPNPALSEITETFNNLSLIEEEERTNRAKFVEENQQRDPSMNSQNPNQYQNQKKPPTLPPLSTPKGRKAPMVMMREQHQSSSSSSSNLRLPDLSSSSSRRRRSTAENASFLSTSTNSLNMDTHNANSTSQSSVDRDFLAQFEKIKISTELLDDPTQDTTVIEDFADKEEEEDDDDGNSLRSKHLSERRGHIKKPIRKIWSASYVSPKFNPKAKENSLSVSAFGLKHSKHSLSNSMKSPADDDDDELLRLRLSSSSLLQDDHQQNGWLLNYGGDKRRGLPLRKCWLCKCIFSALKPNKIMLPPILRKVQQKNPLTGGVISSNRLVSPCICSPYCLLIYYENNPQLKLNTPSYLGSARGDLLDEFFP